jgi:hypothetical protein
MILFTSRRLWRSATLTVATLLVACSSVVPQLP